MEELTQSFGNEDQWKLGLYDTLQAEFNLALVVISISTAAHNVLLVACDSLAISDLAFSQTDSVAIEKIAIGDGVYDRIEYVEAPYLNEGRWNIDI
jgi:hypothetical protein